MPTQLKGCDFLLSKWLLRLGEIGRGPSLAGKNSVHQIGDVFNF